MSGDVEVYRLRLSRGTESSHVPDWTIYEDFDRFERRLLEALVEAGSRGRNRDDKSRWLLQAWRSAKGLKDERFGLNSVIGAEVLVDGEWLDMKPRLILPSVVFDAMYPNA